MKIGKQRRKIYADAYAVWGEKSQILMLFEEMSELQKELCKHLRGEDRVDNICEEVADVEIMLEQVKLIFDVEDEVADKKKTKLARLVRRLRTNTHYRLAQETINGWPDWKRKIAEDVISTATRKDND